MTVAAATLVVVVVLLLGWLGVPQRAGEAWRETRAAVAVVRSDLGELDKERALQAHSRRLFGLFVRIVLLAAAALLAPLGGVALLSMPGWLDFDAVLEATLSWPVLLVATAVGVVALRAPRGRR